MAVEAGGPEGVIGPGGVGEAGVADELEHALGAGVISSQTLLLPLSSLYREGAVYYQNGMAWTTSEPYARGVLCAA